jgi:hypothetical protein
VTTGGTTYSENQVTFNVYQDYAGADYEVYGLVSSEVNGTGANRPVWAPVQTGTIVAGQPLTVSTSTFYTEYAIGVTDCATDIESVDVKYSGNTWQTQEPGTFVLVGIAIDRSRIQAFFCFQRSSMASCSPATFLRRVRSFCAIQNR